MAAAGQSSAGTQNPGESQETKTDKKTWLDWAKLCHLIKRAGTVSILEFILAADPALAGRVSIEAVVDAKMGHRMHVCLDGECIGRYLSIPGFCNLMDSRYPDIPAPTVSYHEAERVRNEHRLGAADNQTNATNENGHSGRPRRQAAAAQTTTGSSEEVDDGFVDFASLLDPVLAEQRKQKTQLTRTKKVVDDLKATSEEQEERLGSLETKQKNGIKSLRQCKVVLEKLAQQNEYLKKDNEKLANRVGRLENGQQALRGRQDKSEKEIDSLKQQATSRGLPGGKIGKRLHAEAFPPECGSVAWKEENPLFGEIST